MLNRWIDRWDRFAARHNRFISIGTVGLFVLSCASYAGFVRLPQIDLLPGWLAIAGSSMMNALWWGWLRPRIEQHRCDRDASAAKHDRAESDR